MSQFMLAAMVWISTFNPNWIVPTNPELRFANQETLQHMLYGCDDINPDNEPVCSGDVETVGKTLAIYNHKTKTIWLEENLKTTLPDIVYKSVIVHELVHHIQYASKGKYNCIGQREKEAYDIQDRWLKAQGHVGVMKALELNALYMATVYQCSPFDGFWLPPIE